MNATFTPKEPPRSQSDHATPGSGGGGRLLRRTFIIALVLVSGGLITSSVVELFFRYRESVEGIEALQREMAQGAAFKIQQFVQDIKKTMRASTQTQEIVTSGLTDAFRFELIKLLKIAPAITEATALNSSGREQIKMSRIQTVLAEELGDRSEDEAFVRARSGATYFGPVYFVRESEPYMRVAVPIERFAGDVIGVLIAEVNLKYIWDVVSRITVGRSGYVYVVSREGDLIAHPDISLVLQKRNLRELSQVKAALSGTPVLSAPQPNLAGNKVFPAYALIPELGWAVLVERPASEAYELLYASVLRTSILLLFGLGMAALASYLIGRRVVRPIAVLREGAARIGAGALEHRINVQTGDELEALAGEFNRMASQVQESYANLEQKVEERTKELTEALEQQTAMSEILRVIAGSPTDVQPVLDTVIANAVKLSGAKLGHIRQVDGEFLRFAAHYGETPEQIAIFERTPVRLDSGSQGSQSILERRVIHVPDTQLERRPATQAILTGARTLLIVPLLREGTGIGTITIWRDVVEPFTERQIDLVKTFADQAVIAIENVRLFKELEARNREISESLEQQTATSQILGVIASSPTDVQPVLDVVAERAARLCEATDAVIHRIDGDSILSVANYGSIPTRRGEGRPISINRYSIPGRTVIDRRTLHINDLAAEPEDDFPAPFARRLGVRTVLATPLLREGTPIGTIHIRRMEVRHFTDKQIKLLETFASQAVIAIENVRLFHEIEQKSVQLEAANKHKSQFLANVSHELRTPLNAIIGFTRLVLRKTEGQIADLQKENLRKVLISSEHLLGLINGLLDLAKIEAGRLEVIAESFRLEEVIQVATSTVEPMLKDGRVRLVKDIAPDLPSLNSDRDKLKQVILNLLSNAAKFTEQGEIKVSAWHENGSIKLTVSDTGIGMKQEALAHIFEEFRQVDMSTTRKYGGTGLGLAIVKKLVNLLGGEIGVESEEGKGTRFTMTLPINLRSQ